MRGWQSAATLSALFCVACAGLPSKQKAVQYPSAAPLDGLDIAGGGDWPAKEWWKRYQDPTLDELIESGLASSPTLATAHARYDSARQSVRIAGAESGVRIDANADADRQRLSDNGMFPPRLLGFTWYNQFDLGLQASYTFDWWGKQRDAIEAAMDQAHAAQADRSAAALMLASSIADTYFGWQADQGRIALARERADLVEQEGAIAGGRLKARYGATQAAIDSAVASYQDTVVSAARDVATQASTRAQIAAQRTQRVIEVDAAHRLQRSAAARVTQGITDARTELTAAESWIEQRDALLQLDAAALSADIALQRALGGGYGRPPKLANSLSTAIATTQ